MDRHQFREILSRLLSIVKTVDQITAPWKINSSRRWWWSCTLWRYYVRIQGKVRWYFAMANWRLDIFSGKLRRTKEKCFNLVLNPNSSKHFLYFRAIQGHSGGNLVDPALQDNVLLPEDFTEYIYHIGSVSEIHSIIRSGLIPGGGSLTRDRQSVFYNAVNPMDDHQNMEEIGVIWTSQGHSGLVQCKARSEERIAMFSNTIKRNRSL